MSEILIVLWTHFKRQMLRTTRGLPISGGAVRLETPQLRRRVDADRLLRRAAGALSEVLGEDLNADTYYAQPSADQAFTLLRTRTESAGVFVLRKGDLGSHHTAIDVETFRGFAIADDVAPFVVINDNDSRAAWSFTLLHELTHLLLGQTGISGSHSGEEIEEFCNNVAAEWLLPVRTLDQILICPDRDLVDQQRRIDEFARPRNLSRTMVAYRLLRADRIDWRTFDRLHARFHERWRQQRDRLESQAGLVQAGRFRRDRSADMFR